jgi:3-oxoacyl-[acyl-carrier protein] reductase
MLFSLCGKVALITGSGRGIGAAIARCFARQGAAVVVANRTREPADTLVRNIRAEGGRAISCAYDASSKSGNETVVNATLSEYGGIDILVHNAGSVTAANLDSMDDAVLNDALDVNLKACFWLTRAVVPAMRSRGGGRILVTSSVTGPRVASFGLSHYAASKAGVNGFIRSAALELAKDKITVNGVEPGFITVPHKDQTQDDAFFAGVAQYIPLGSLGSPDDIAHAMLFFASNEASYITGQTLIVDGGAILPESPLVLGPRITAAL